jgi:hypothetical protein
MPTFRTDRHGIVRDSTSIYWFGGIPCDIIETDEAMLAIVKENNEKPELWQYLYCDKGYKWEFVRTYKAEQSARAGMLRYAKRIERVQS